MEPVDRPSLLCAFRRFRRTLAHPLLDVLFPSDCFCCRRALGPLHLIGACLACWSELRAIRPPWCPGCGAPLPQSTDLLGPARGRCVPCVLRRRAPDGVRAAVVYDAVARRFLLRAKYGGRRELLALLGRQLRAAVAASEFGRECTVVLPVPSHPWTMLRRGFNPALDIAVPLARGLGLRLGRRLLRCRARRAGPVKRLGAAGRRLALEGVFRASPRVRGERVLLVDDVFTTGATAESCARALRRAGAATVLVAVWARTPLLRASE